LAWFRGPAELSVFAGFRMAGFGPVRRDPHLFEIFITSALIRLALSSKSRARPTRKGH
jgi:hypothetical protein